MIQETENLFNNKNTSIPFSFPRPSKTGAANTLIRKQSLAYHETSQKHQDRVIFLPNTVCKKFSSQAAPEVLTVPRKIAESEGCPRQEILDEAPREYIERKGKSQLRCPTMNAFAQSLSEFDQLYRELAQ